MNLETSLLYNLLYLVFFILKAFKDTEAVLYFTQVFKNSPKNNEWI